MKNIGFFFLLLSFGLFAGERPIAIECDLNNEVVKRQLTPKMYDENAKPLVFHFPQSGYEVGVELKQAAGELSLRRLGIRKLKGEQQEDVYTFKKPKKSVFVNALFKSDKKSEEDVSDIQVADTEDNPNEEKIFYSALTDTSEETQKDEKKSFFKKPEKKVPQEAVNCSCAIIHQSIY